MKGVNLLTFQQMEIC